MIDKKRCAKCQFQGRTGVWSTCDYILITGHRRPKEKDGKCCPVYSPANPLRPRVDRDKLRELYQEGLCDTEIAKLAGCHVSSVGRWRKANHLQVNLPAQKRRM